MVNDIKNNLINRKDKITSYMIEKFKESFEYSTSGAIRNWRIYEDSVINKYFEKAV